MPKVYRQTLVRGGREYSYKKVFFFPKESLGDLAMLLGAESVCKLVKYFGGSHVYVPCQQSVKREIMVAAMLARHDELRKKGASRESIIYALAEDFKELWTRSSIEKKIGKWNGRKTDALKRAGRDVLLTQIKKHREVFERYGLL